MLKDLDSVLVLLLWGFLVVASGVCLVQLLRGKARGYGLLSVLPENWVRWLMDEKTDIKAKH